MRIAPAYVSRCEVRLDLSQRRQLRQCYCADATSLEARFAASHRAGTGERGEVEMARGAV